ncbi:hypothetical protein C7964_10560 [Loktanella sp. PT4BL]|jgi:hypothetical protein|uniref:hypothetical protein n=1 Tax=Loktanella sp. PT4BL TaxID=2135611 RepID=UPI000D76E480|nr:hypothetical protein [Loktanella sp. PT4BL]PXW67711.1 hypothetical protein C7964_10560 [Loktanella sp. PT4BL]
MKWLALFLLMPVAGFAQTFGAPPVVELDGMTFAATETDACINDQVTKGPGGLVTRAARACIGYSARACTADPVACAAGEKAYWDWRIAMNYGGLQAWVADRAEGDNDDLRASVANPGAATANVVLECALRVGQTETTTAEADKAACEMRETALIALELEFTVRQACAAARDGAFAQFCGKTDG